MKKIVKALALVIALICVFTAFVACDSDGEDANKENSKGVEYYITYKGTKIELDKKADSVLSALGTPKTTASLGDCGGFGTQTKYVYDDIVVYTLKNDNGETIDQITLSNDIVETEKGICIGSSSEDVLAKYGDPTSRSDSKLEYANGSLYLKFSLDNGEVKSINFIRVLTENN